MKYQVFFVLVRTENRKTYLGVNGRTENINQALKYNFYKQASDRALSMANHSNDPGWTIKEIKY